MLMTGITIGKTTRVNLSSCSIVLFYASLPRTAILLDIGDENVHSKAMDNVALPTLAQT
jgi:hypothetical protein